MAAIDTPWMDSMTSTNDSKDGSVSLLAPGELPTIAAFSPASATTSYSATQRNTILVHQKSPLLLATPPQITRALAYSHPFIVPLNKLAGLVTWTTDDPWESFLLLACFCGATLYGDILVRWTGPLLVVAALVLGLYWRRFSPLSSTSLPGEKGGKLHQRKDSEGKTQHHKSLDEIVETLKLFTSRCNILLEPFLYLTDFLSTQSTATSATTRPALTTLFLRILLLTPAWFILTLPFVNIITTKRVIFTLGTIGLSYHSRPARITRTILWRSLTVRRTCSAITGLPFPTTSPAAGPFKFPKSVDGKPTRDANSIAALLAASRNRRKGKGDKELAKGTKSESIRFTFTLYENQRRWIGIGWTSSMLAYERAAWTDDQLNPTAGKDRFELPEVEGGFAKWRWCDESTWSIEGGDGDIEVGNANNSTTAAAKTTSAAQVKEAVENPGWIYYDTKWRFGRLQDGWGRYTRRRKWCRDAELVEIPLDSSSSSQLSNPGSVTTTTVDATGTTTTNSPATTADRKHKANSSIDSTTTSPSSTAAMPKSKRPWFGTRSRTNSNSDVNAHARTRPTKQGHSSLGTEGDGTDKESVGSQSFSVSGGRDDSEEDDGYIPMAHRIRQGVMEAAWGVGEDVGMELG